MTHRASRTPLHALSTLALALSSAGAFAQSTEPAVPANTDGTTKTEAVTLPAVRVVGAGEKANGPVTGYTARRSATVTRTDTPLNEVPQSVTVISAEQVRDQNSLTLQEALRYAAGVNSESYGLDNRGDYFAVRASDGLTLIDGLRAPITGYWGAVRNEPYAFERIEVLRGPASMLAGQNPPGGLINMVSKRPQFQASREVQVQVGTDDHKLIAADLTGPIDDDGRLAYRLVMLGKDSGSQVDWATQKRELFAPSITWKPLSGTTFTLYYQYQKDKSLNQNAFLPFAGTLVSAPNGPIPYKTFIGEPDWDTYGGSRNRSGYEFEQKIGNDWTVRQRLRFDEVNADLITAYADYSGFVDAAGQPDVNGTYLNRGGYAAIDRSRIITADLQVEGKLNFGGTSHTVLAAVDHFSHRSVHGDFQGFAMTPLDVYNPVYGTSPLPALVGPLDSPSAVHNFGVTLQDQIKFGKRWVVVAGLRHDQAKNETLETSAVSKNLGVVFLADGGWSPYVGYSESFQPIGGSGRTGDAFRPSRGKQLEAGVKWMPADSQVSASAAVYKLKERNRLAPDPLDINFSVQQGEATVDGFELEGNARLAAWDLLANYTYTRARLTGDVDDNQGLQLSGIRKNTVSGWALHRFGAIPGLRAGGGVRYIAESGDGTGSNVVPAVTLLDVLVGYDTGPWSVTFNVNNLTDKTYLATCLNRGDCWFGTKRRGVLTVAYRW